MHRRGQGKRPSCRDDGTQPRKSGQLDDDDPPIAPLTWAQRTDVPRKQVFEFEITLCPDCGGRLQVIAGAVYGVPPTDMTDPAVIPKILDHIHQSDPPVWRSTPEQYAISSAPG